MLHNPSGFGGFYEFTIYSPGGHLCHVTWIIYINNIFPLQEGCIRNLVLIGTAVSEIFKVHDHIHGLCPGAWAANPLGPNYFHKHILSIFLLPAIFAQFNATLPIFPIQTHWRL